MSEDGNQLTVECQRAGVYQLSLAWRPLTLEEVDQTAKQPIRAKSESGERDFSPKEIPLAPGITATLSSTATTGASEEAKEEPCRRVTSTKTPKIYKEDEVRKKGKKSKIHKMESEDGGEKEVKKNGKKTKGAELDKKHEEENKATRRKGKQLKGDVGEDGAPSAGPPPVRPCRPLYSLEVYEVTPTAGWVRAYHGAGTECCLRKLKPNVSHRVRVRSDAGVSQVHSFSTLPAPISVSDLHRAVLLDRVERVQAILTQRPRAVNAASTYGLSALMVAAREGFRQMTSLLLGRGADVNQRSEGADKTALMFASFAGQREIADQLLAAGAMVTVQDRSGRAALHHAADGGSAALVRCLVAGGAPLEQTDSEGWTPLMRAVMLGGPVSALVELGARTDGSDRRGRQLRRMSPSPLRTAELLGVWRRSALVLPPWRRGSSQPPPER